MFKNITNWFSTSKEESDTVKSGGQSKNSFLQFWFGSQSKPIKAVMLGLDAAGKTTLLYRLSRGSDVVTTIPTIGFNVETVQFKRTDFVCWDVGGCDKIRPLWRHFLEGVDLLVLVVDAKDRDRISSAYEEFNFFLTDYQFPLLVLSNKQDLENIMSLAEIIEKLKLDSITDRRWEILPICATNGEGADEILPAMERLVRPFVEGEKSGQKLIHEKSSKAENLSKASLLFENTSGKKGAFEEVPAAPTVKEGESVPASSPAPPAAPVATSAPDPLYLEHQRRLLDAVWDDWTQRPLRPETDEELLAQLASYKLDIWDHYTHVRVAYAWLVLHGWDKGSKRICQSLADFIANSARTNEPGGTGGGRSFHHTMTMFWASIIYYWLLRFQQKDGEQPVPMGDDLVKSQKMQDTSFSDFLTFVASHRDSSTDLADKALFRQYYNSPTIFGEMARKEFVASDLKPFPSL
jgi:small GTP-binding protein